MSNNLIGSSLIVPDVVRVIFRDLACKYGPPENAYEPPSRLVVTNEYATARKAYTTLLPTAYGAYDQLVHGCLIDAAQTIALGRVIQPKAIRKNHFPSSPRLMGALNMEGMQQLAGLALMQHEHVRQPDLVLIPLIGPGWNQPLDLVEADKPVYAWSWVLPRIRTTKDIYFVSVLMHEAKPVHALYGIGYAKRTLTSELPYRFRPTHRNAA